MVKYVIKRILLSVFILFGVSVILYFLVRLMPVSYIENQYYASHPNVGSDEDLRRVLELYGLHDNSFLGIRKCLDYDTWDICRCSFFAVNFNALS